MLIRRYIGKRFFSMVCLVMAVSSAMFLIASVILWSPSMTASGWSEQRLFLYIVCQIPWFLSNIYPAIVAVGTLLSFSLLAQHNELIVLQTAGLSPFDFIKIILLPALVLALFGFVLISYLGPMAYNFSQNMRINETHFHSVWLKEKNHVIAIKKMSSGDLYQMNIYDLAKTGLKKFYQATDTLIGNTSTLHAVLIKSFHENAVSEKYIQTLTWPDLLPNLHSLNLLTKSERRLNLFDVCHLIKLNKAMGLNSTSYQFLRWRMILLPFFSLMLMFTMMQFAFKENGSRKLINNILLGLTISLIFYFVNQITWPLALLFNLPVLLGAFIAPMSIVILCVLLKRFF